MIKFTCFDGTSIYINRQNILFIYLEENEVCFRFMDGSQIRVKEDEDEVVARLYGQQLNPFTRTGDYGRL